MLTEQEIKEGREELERLDRMVIHTETGHIIVRAYGMRPGNYGCRQSERDRFLRRGKPDDIAPLFEYAEGTR